MAQRTSRNDGRGRHTLREIRSQADSWEASLEAVARGKARFREMFDNADEILFAGCGSAYNVSRAVAPFFQAASGKTCRAVHASDLEINPVQFLNGSRRTLAVVCSRSGETTESVLALRRSRSLGCPTLAVTCFARSAMAREADASLVLDGAVEKSVTTTRSLTSMVLAGYALAALAGADSPGPGSGLERDLSRLPAVCRSGMGRFEELGRRVSEDREIVKYAFLGTGSMYGLAREGQLKFKEMVLLPSDSYVTLDFRHGPMSNVDGGMLVTLLSSEPALAFEREVARDMKSLGGKVFALGCGAGFEDVADYVLDLRTLEGGLGEPGGPGAAVAGATPWVQAAASVRATPWVLATPWVAGVLYMPAIQFMAYYTSLAVGCDPDKPRNLSYYVKVTSPPEPPRSRRSSRSRGAP